MFSIVTISCFASILFIPIGIALMWLYTDWKRSLKAVLSAVLALFYAGLVVFFLLFEPSSPNDNSVNLSVPTEQVNSNLGASGHSQNENPQITETDSTKKGKASNQSKKEEKMPSSLKKTKNGNAGRIFYSILFFLFMLFLVIWQNLKKNKKIEDDNPYVDVSKYKLPLSDNSKMPLVHFLRLRLNPNEQLCFASKTTQKKNEGDFVITNQRVVIFSPEETIEFPIQVLTAVTSVTDSVMQLTSGERKYYIFLPESQMKYALAVLRWCAKKSQEGQNEK